MTDYKLDSPAKAKSIYAAVLVIAGICIFGLFIHANAWQRLISFAGLALVAVVVSFSVRDIKSLLEVTGLVRFNRTVIYFSLAGIIFGVLLGLVYNLIKADSLLPVILTRFALLAPLIGIAEEGVFRGYVQGKAAPAGSLASVLIASFGHTLYKYFVISTVEIDLGTYFPSLIGFTFLAGAILGFMRYASGSIYPPALAHALFDILVYGGEGLAPVWIWG